MEARPGRQRSADKRWSILNDPAAYLAETGWRRLWRVYDNEHDCSGTEYEECMNIDSQEAWTSLRDAKAAVLSELENERRRPA